jgi:hypothetical protein
MCYSDNCRVSDKGIKQLCRMQQLTELRLGRATEKADGDNNTFTIDGFGAVLDVLGTMPKLTVLDMQLPHVKELDIRFRSIHSSLNLATANKGAQFVA